MHRHIQEKWNKTILVILNSLFFLSCSFRPPVVLTVSKAMKVVLQIYSPSRRSRERSGFVWKGAGWDPTPKAGTETSPLVWEESCPSRCCLAQRRVQKDKLSPVWQLASVERRLHGGPLWKSAQASEQPGWGLSLPLHPWPGSPQCPGTSCPRFSVEVVIDWIFINI